MDPGFEKKEIRRRMKARRKVLKPTEKREYDRWVCRELYRIIERNGFKVVHAYIPLQNEINIAPLLRELLEKDIRVICPKALPNGVLENRELHSFQDLERGVMGTQHPANPVEYTGPIDMVIIPGLAFDRDKFRVGYGGAYYDTFLTMLPNTTLKVGVFYPFQEIEQVPREEHDMPFDKLLVGE